MKYKSLLFSVLIGGAGMLSTQALAGGSVGGNCCADLEERVAELEATTARKGNRRVTLTVSGNVAYALFFNDTSANPGGTQEDVTIGQTAAVISKFRFSGKAKITSDVFAGYRVEFGIGATDLGSFGRDTGNLTPAGNIDIRYNEVFIGSKTFGKISIGQGSTASDFASEVDLSGTLYFAGGNLDEYNVVDNLDGFSRRERIRYDTPTIAGFKFSTSWQDNDDWDVALRYGGSWGDFTVAAAIAYFEDAEVFNAGGALVATDVGATVGSFSILHRPTGLSLTAAAGDRDLAFLGVEEYWYVKAGIQRKVLSLGKTKFSVDYKDINDGNVEKFGVQLVQDIDAAAMKVSASFWHADSDDPSPTLPDETAGYIGVAIFF